MRACVCGCVAGAVAVCASACMLVSSIQTEIRHWRCPFALSLIGVSMHGLMQVELSKRELVLPREMVVSEHFTLVSTGWKAGC